MRCRGAPKRSRRSRQSRVGGSPAIFTTAPRRRRSRCPSRLLRPRRAADCAVDATEIEATAAAFEAAALRGEYFPQDWADRLAIDEAYRILLTRLRLRGVQRVGWKVGLTARAIQEQFGVHEPGFGCLLADGLKPHGHVFSRVRTDRARLRE